MIFNPNGDLFGVGSKKIIGAMFLEKKNQYFGFCKNKVLPFLYCGGMLVTYDK